MDSLYGAIDDKQLSNNLEDIAKQIFSCLYKREEGYDDLPFFITCLIYRIQGLNSILESSPQLISVMSLLQAAREESSFRVYRKLIFDACGILYKMKEELDESCLN